MEHNSSMSVWAIARSFTFLATTKVLKQPYAWAEIYLNGLWTTEFAAPAQSLTACIPWAPRDEVK